MLGLREPFLWNPTHSSAFVAWFAVSQRRKSAGVRKYFGVMTAYGPGVRKLAIPSGVCRFRAASRSWASTIPSAAVWPPFTTIVRLGGSSSKRITALTGAAGKGVVCQPQRLVAQIERHPIGSVGGSVPDFDRVGRAHRRARLRGIQEARKRRDERRRLDGLREIHDVKIAPGLGAHRDRGFPSTRRPRRPEVMLKTALMMAKTTAPTSTAITTMITSGISAVAIFTCLSSSRS